MDMNAKETYKKLMDEIFKYDSNPTYCLAAITLVNMFGLETVNLMEDKWLIKYVGQNPNNLAMYKIRWTSVGTLGESGEDTRRIKRKTVWAYLDGKKLVDVVQAALDNDMMVDDLKKQLIKENRDHEITFKCEWLPF